MNIGLSMGLSSIGGALWTPRAASVAPTLWLRADMGLTPGAAVATWPDQSGNGADYTQASAPQRPTCTAAAGPQASLPGIVCVAASSQRVSRSAAVIPTKDFTVATVAKSTSASAQALFSSGSTGDGWTVGYNVNGDSSRAFNAAGVAAVSDGAITTSWEAWIFQSDTSGNLSLLVNGVAKTLTPSNATALTGSSASSVGALGATRFLDGTVWEVIVYPHKISASDLTALLAYQSRITGLF